MLTNNKEEISSPLIELSIAAPCFILPLSLDRSHSTSFVTPSLVVDLGTFLVNTSRPDSVFIYTYCKKHLE